MQYWIFYMFWWSTTNYSSNSRFFFVHNKMFVFFKCSVIVVVSLKSYLLEIAATSSTQVLVCLVVFYLHKMRNGKEKKHFLNYLNNNLTFRIFLFSFFHFFFSTSHWFLAFRFFLRLTTIHRLCLHVLMEKMINFATNDNN